MSRAEFYTIYGNWFPTFTNNTYCGDTGSSCQLTNDSQGFCNLKTINKVIYRIRKGTQATKVGKKLTKVTQADDSRTI